MCQTMKKSYAVFGLGRYGIAVARELVKNGMEVIANTEKIAKLKQRGFAVKKKHSSEVLLFLCAEEGSAPSEHPRLWTVWSLARVPAAVCTVPAGWMVIRPAQTACVFGKTIIFYQLCDPNGPVHHDGVFSCMVSPFVSDFYRITKKFFVFCAKTFVSLLQTEKLYDILQQR